MFNECLTVWMLNLDVVSERTLPFVTVCKKLLLHTHKHTHTRNRTSIVLEGWKPALTSDECHLIVKELLVRFR